MGGLSVLRPIREIFPNEHILYFADQAHVPYGSRSLAEIRHFSEEITRFLLDQGAKIIVVACNTASAAALSSLRETFPEVAFVGMEPAVKPAALETRSGKVGVLATENTFSSPRYALLMSRFAQDVEVIENPCRGLVSLIEAGDIATGETEALLRRVLDPMLAAGVDTLVLGCTHYPFVRPLIEGIVDEIGTGHYGDDYRSCAGCGQADRTRACEAAVVSSGRRERCSTPFYVSKIPGSCRFERTTLVRRSDCRRSSLAQFAVDFCIICLPRV